MEKSLTTVVVLVVLIPLMWMQHASGQCIMITDHSGTITSPGHPGNYQNYLDICWTFDTGYPMELQFSNFNFETNYDWVRVYSGPTTFGTELEYLTGFVGSRLVSVDDLVSTMRMSTDYSVTRSGFSMTYTALVPTTLMTTQETTVVTTEQSTVNEFSTADDPEEMLGLCDRQQLIDNAPRLHALTIADNGDIYLMISSVLEYDGGSFLTGNHFILLDPEDDFPLRVHHMAVYYNHTITEISGMVDLQAGVMITQPNTVSQNGGLITGPVYPVHANLITLDASASEDTVYRVFPDNIEMEVEIEHFPWYMPDWCSIEVTTSVPVEVKDFPWIYLYLMLVLFVLVLLFIIACCAITRKASNKEKKKKESNVQIINVQ